MAIKFRHPHNRLGQDGVQVTVELEEITPVLHKTGEYIRLRKIKSACEPRQYQSRDKNVSQRVVMADLMFPTHVSRQVDGPVNRLAALPDPQIGRGIKSADVCR